MAWNDKYLTGVEEIDNKQIELVETIVRFKDALSERMADTEMEVGNILKYLVNYSQVHFPVEEEYMERISYNGYEEHIKQHREFTGKLIGILSLLRGKGSYRPIQLYYFLIHWLDEHIAVEDRKLAEFKTGKDDRLKFESDKHLEGLLRGKLKTIENMFISGDINVKEREDKRTHGIRFLYNSFIIEKGEDLLKLLKSIDYCVSIKILEDTEGKRLKEYLAQRDDLKQIIHNESDTPVGASILEFLSS